VFYPFRSGGFVLFISFFEGVGDQAGIEIIDGQCPSLGKIFPTKTNSLTFGPDELTVSPQRFLT
jgi:hypothetical protein